MATGGAPPTYRSGSTSVTAEGAAVSDTERAAALAFLQQLALEVSKGSIDLPCFPNVVVRVSAALMEPTSTSGKMVAIVGTEPRLAARLLQTANSAAFNTAGKPVTELRTAITRIGQQLVQSTAVSYAMQQMQQEASLRSIAKPMADLWVRSVRVATLCQLLAERTKVHTDEAFLAGLVHGIGSLYIMARAAAEGGGLRNQQAWFEMLDGWQASIGKAVLESWGFAEKLCEAVGDQHDHGRRWQHDAGLTDILIVGIILADALADPQHPPIAMDGINAFASIGLNATDCEATLLRAERRIAAVSDALK